MCSANDSASTCQQLWTVRSICQQPRVHGSHSAVYSDFRMMHRKKTALGPQAVPKGVGPGAKPKGPERPGPRGRKGAEEGPCRRHCVGTNILGTGRSTFPRTHNCQRLITPSDPRGPKPYMGPVKLSMVQCSHLGSSLPICLAAASLLASCFQEPWHAWIKGNG